jgi:hypothetical protein
MQWMEVVLAGKLIKPGILRVVELIPGHREGLSQFVIGQP